MNEEPITRYYELRRQQMEIERQLEALKPEVAERLRQQQGVALFDGYELRLNAYTAWTYSPQVAELQRTLTETKRRERLDGTAKVRERRDMLVLRSRLEPTLAVREEAAAYGEEWELDDA